MLLAMSFGAGQALKASNASTKQAFEENPVAGVTVPDMPAILPIASGSTPSTSAAPATTTTNAPAAPATPTTTANTNVVCRWTAKILAGGIAGPLLIGPSDRFAVTVTNSDWSGKSITYRANYVAPAVLRPVLAMPATTAIADAAGTVTFLLPVGPEAQGGAISVLAEVVGTNSQLLDVCGWQQFAVDYNGAQGLVGGIVNSAAKLLKL
jgi:hypothetical protein